MNSYQFIDFLVIHEHEMDNYSPIAGSYAIVKCSGKFLICYNKWRNQWEFPAGKRELHESAKQCAMRELYEETGQIVYDLRFIGLVKSKNDLSGKQKFNPVYMTEVQTLQPFIENDEIEKTMLWDMTEEINPFDSLDKAFIPYLLDL